MDVWGEGDFLILRVIRVVRGKGIGPVGVQTPELTAEYTEYADPSQMVTGAGAPVTGLETKPRATDVRMPRYERMGVKPVTGLGVPCQLARADWNPQQIGRAHV